MTRLRKLPAVEEQFQSAKTTIYKQVKNGTLPPPIHLGEKSSAWIAAELDAVLAARIAGRSDAEIRALVIALVAARSRQADDAAACAGVGQKLSAVKPGADAPVPPSAA